MDSVPVFQALVASVGMSPCVGIFRELSYPNKAMFEESPLVLDIASLLLLKSFPFNIVYLLFFFNQIHID